MLAELDSLNLLVTAERPKPRAMTFDDLSNMKYTSHAIKVSKCRNYRKGISIELYMHAHVCSGFNEGIKKL